MTLHIASNSSAVDSLSHRSKGKCEIADTLAKADACEVSEPSPPLTFLEIFSRTKHQNKTAAWITPPPPEHHWYQCSHPGGSLAHDGYACSHPRVPRSHQSGLSGRSLAGVGLSESVRCHGPGLSLLTNGSVQQQQQFKSANFRFRNEEESKQDSQWQPVTVLDVSDKSNFILRHEMNDDS
ncbi:hypothetical protein TNCV_2488891 [Trichonephila clavipes]|nr:hypothetical protein TNCV_2488891 [Trichonephila clavipes]